MEDIVENMCQVPAVVTIAVPRSQQLELCPIDKFHSIGNFLEARYLQSLTLLDGLDIGLCREQ